jgi:hypothetical protein
MANATKKLQLQLVPLLTCNNKCIMPSPYDFEYRYMKGKEGGFIAS